MDRNEFTTQDELGTTTFRWTGCEGLIVGLDGEAVQGRGFRQPTALSGNNNDPRCLGFRTFVEDPQTRGPFLEMLRNKHTNKHSTQA